MGVTESGVDTVTRQVYLLMFSSLGQLSSHKEPDERAIYRVDPI